MKNMVEIVEDICPDDYYRARSLKNVGYQYANAHNLKYHKKGNKKYYDKDAEFLIKERLRKVVPQPRIDPNLTVAIPSTLTKYDVNLSTIVYKVNPLLGSQESKRYRALDSKALAYIENQQIKTEVKSYDYYLTQKDADKVENYLEGVLANSTDFNIPESKTVILFQEQNKRLVDKIKAQNKTIDKLEKDNEKLHATISQLLTMRKK